MLTQRDAEREQAQQQYQALLARLQTVQAEASNLALLIEKLKLQIAVLRRHRFGASSEKLDGEIGQLELILEELEASQAQMPAAPIEAPLKQTPIRKPLPEHLPRETITHAPVCACPNCGGQALRLIGTDTTEVLEYVPERFKVIRHERPKYACQACDTLVQAPAASRPIAKGVAGAGLLAHVLISKYADHLPLYRQSEILAREGIDIPRSTLADWVGGASSLLSPLVQALREYVFKAQRLHTDDTPVPVLQPGRGTTKLGRLWTYVRDDRNSGNADPPAVWLAYSPDRKAAHPQAHLKGFRGFLQADAYAGYDALYGQAKLTEVACWAHARRNFYELYETHRSPIAQQALLKIAQLYEIEARIRGKPPPHRAQVRQTEAHPILVQFKDWLYEQLAQVSKKSELAKAIGYALGRWTALTRYVNDGTLEIDNNIAENSIRPIALGKKNWLFAGSDAGGKRAANIYSLLGTAKMHGLNPQAYLTYVLERIADTKITALDQLLPWNAAPMLTTQTTDR